MKYFFALLFFFIAGHNLFSQSRDSRYFELRTYYVRPGQMELVLDRFKNNTTGVFEKLGMENIGYWIPANNDQGTFYYLLAYPDKNARKKSWDAFRTDPEWTEFWSKAQGKIVDSVKTVFLNTSEILPKMNVNSKLEGRVFELRTYTCFPGRLPNLTARFKNHTTKLFEKHGMENVAYFTTIEEPGVQPRLIYFLAHPSEELSKKSWDDFRNDSDWIKARDASEKDGKIVEKVVSVYLKPTSFSKVK